MQDDLKPIAPQISKIGGAINYTTSNSQRQLEFRRCSKNLDHEKENF